MSCNKRDIDAVVNSNILYYLGYSDKTAAVVDWMVDVIDKSEESTCDKWYRRPILVYYFFSKNFSQNISKLNPLRNIIKTRILKNSNKNGSFYESALDTALAISTLYNAALAHAVPQNAIQYLLEQQKPDGSWAKWSIFYGNPNRMAGYGSDVLTTSHVIEALNLYSQNQLYKVSK
jgi:hypothetical protein